MLQVEQGQRVVVVQGRDVDLLHLNAERRELRGRLPDRAGDLGVDRAETGVGEPADAQLLGVVDRTALLTALGTRAEPPAGDEVPPPRTSADGAPGGVTLDKADDGPHDVPGKEAADVQD